MLILRQKNWGFAAKPVDGACLNFSHPLARGLLVFSPLNENLAKRVANLARPCFPGPYVNASGTEALVWDNSARWGHGVTTTDSGNREYFDYGRPSDGSFETPNGITVMAVTSWMGDQFTKTRIAAKGTGTADANVEWSLGNGQSNTLWRWQVQTSGGLRTTEFTKDSLVHMITGTYDGVDQKIYEDSVLKATNNRNEAISTSTGSVQLMGSTTSATNANWRNPIYLFGYWNRALSADEIRWLYQEPFDMVVSPARRIFPAPAAVAGKAGIHYFLMAGRG